MVSFLNGYCKRFAAITHEYLCLCSVFQHTCREDEDPEYKPLRMPFKDDLDDFTNSPLDDKDDAAEGETEGNR